MRTRTWRLFALSALCLLGAAPVRAEPAPAPTVQVDEILVKEGFRTAEALRAGGDLTGAMAVLRMTYDRVRTPFLLWPMAELSLKLLQPLSGLQALDEYVAKLPPQAEADVQAGLPSAAEVQKTRAQLVRQMAHLELSTDEPGALLILDGRQLGRSPLPAPNELDPGRHRIEAQGAKKVTEEVTLGPGERRALALPVAVRAKEPSRQPELFARYAAIGLGAAALIAGGALLGEDGACTAAGTCEQDLRTPGAALLGISAGVLATTALFIGLEVRRAGGGAKGLRLVVGPASNRQR